MRRPLALICSFALLAPAIAADAPEGINLRRTVTVRVVEKTKGAVVSISTTRLIDRRISRFGNDPFLAPFDPGEVVRVPASYLGSGFIVHPDGYVVTNNHVIDRARQITVEMADGRKLPADLISSDADADLAILKVSTDRKLPVLDLGDSGDLMIGEPVIAVGNPLGFSHSVTTGVVSAVHRELKDESDKVLLADLVQTDAAINRGNSGGPLLNAYGQVIGINTAIRGDAQNIGFAIPVNRLRDLIPELMNPGQVSKMDVPVKLTERRTVEPPATVKVTVLASLSGADPKVVSTINGRAPADIVDAYAILLRTKPGDPVVVRTTDGRESRVSTKAMPVPDAVVQAKRRLGIGVEPVTPMLAQKYGLAVEDGLFITDVARGSAAEAANLQPGDVILQLGRYRVQNLDDFSVLLQHMPAQGNVFIVVVRGQQILRGQLKLNAATSHASGPGL